MRIQILKVGARAGQIVADNQMISRMVATYNPRFHEAPLFVEPGGHDAPAVGWVSSLSQGGNALFAEVGQMNGKIEEDLLQKRRRISRVGFYANYGLRHIGLTGEPISLFSGSPSLFKDHEQYFEFQERGYDMGVRDDPRMQAFMRLGNEIHCGLPPKEFSEGDDPGEILHRKAMDITMNPPAFSESGVELGKTVDYSTAFQMACQQNPDLTARYIEQLEAIRKKNMTPTTFR